MREVLNRFYKVLSSRPSPQDVSSVLESSRAGLLITIINAFLVAFGSGSVEKLDFIAIWLTSTLALTGVIYFRSQAASGRAVTRVSRRATVRLVIFAVLLALPWASLALAVLSSSYEAGKSIVFLVCAGMAAGGTFMLYRVLLASLAFYATILSAIVAGCVLGGSPAPVPVLIFALTYFFALSYFSLVSGDMARQRDSSVEALSAAVSDLQDTQKTIQNLAQMDTVTRLINRQTFVDRLEAACQAVRDGGKPFSLLLFDLDRFKNINDTFGHSVGDELLAYIGVRVGNELGQKDTFARLGGDEFAILISGVSDCDRVRGIAKRLAGQLHAPITLSERQIYTGASFGAVTCPDHGNSAEQLMLNADLALNHVKETGRGGCAIFDDHLREKTDQNDWIERELRAAMQKQDITVHYQPQICLQSDQVAGAEALVRWTHEDSGPISPEVFLHVAAERGLMPTLSRYITDTIKSDILNWRATGSAHPKIALNIHPMDFRSPGVLFDTVARFSEVGITEKDILLEITEGCFLGRGTDAALFTLDELSDRGFELSLDDFGTGHASISHLKKLPVSEIKIDRSFVMAIEEGKKDRSIVAATVEIARGMGLRTVAEGVETETHKKILSELGVCIGQGYLWAKALPRDEFAAFVEGRGLATPQEATVTTLQSASAQSS